MRRIIWNSLIFLLSYSYLNVNLKGSDFAWRNLWDRPSLKLLDHFLIFVEWEDMFSSTIWKTLPNNCPNHVPTARVFNFPIKKSNVICFKHCWTMALGYDLS